MQCLGKSTKIKNLARCAHRFEGSKRMPTLLKSNRLRAAILVMTAINTVRLLLYLPSSYTVVVGSKKAT